MTARWTIDPAAPSPSIIGRAAALLRKGRLVAFPTETVYGLGGDATSAEAVSAIYAAKGRPADNPLIVHVLDEAHARAVTRSWPEAAAQLADAFWPGPLTLVLPRARELPTAVTAGLDAVGVRAPTHPVARALLAASQRPLAAPSANRANHISPTSADHVAKSLGERIDAILDGGPTPIGIESTVVSLIGAPTVLRHGQVSREALVEILGPVAVAPGGPGDGPLPSPGRGPRHYAPDVPLVLVTEDRWEETVARQRGRVGTITLERQGDHQLGRDPSPYGARLYAALHDLEARCDVILAETPPDTPAWAAVWDRLRRAATPP